MADAASVDALVFDLGGVLVEVDIRRALHHWATSAGVPVETLSSRWKQDEAYCAHERGQLDDAGFFAHLRRLLDIDIGAADVLEGWNAALGEPLAGIAPLLQELAAEFPLYVFSNTNPAHIAHFTPRYRSLFAHFREVVTSCGVGARKPDSEAFLRLSQRIGVAPDKLAFFDDLEQNVAGARRAGLRAYRVTSAGEIAAISETLRPGRTARRWPRPLPGA